MPTNSFSKVKELIYDKCSFNFSSFLLEKESKDYEACKFQINNIIIIGRLAKQTPTKTGQFVTLWKRIEGGIIKPFDITDSFDFFVINTKFETNFGQFIFPKSVLLAKGIISSNHKGGKRGIRVYPPWAKTISKQAQKTQKWQLAYFLPINTLRAIDAKQIKLLYTKKK